MTWGLPFHSDRLRGLPSRSASVMSGRRSGIADAGGDGGPDAIGAFRDGSELALRNQIAEQLRRYFDDYRAYQRRQTA